jgi:hypothetical protein
MSHKINLSGARLAHIREIFDLFHADGGGSVGKRELELALVALGFQKKGGSDMPPPVKQRQRGPADMDRNSLVKDGTVALADFR